MRERRTVEIPVDTGVMVQGHLIKCVRCDDGMEHFCDGCVFNTGELRHYCEKLELKCDATERDDRTSVIFREEPEPVEETGFVAVSSKDIASMMEYLDGQKGT